MLRQVLAFTIALQEIMLINELITTNPSYKFLHCYVDLIWDGQRYDNNDMII